jgi:hypothetical protein
MKTYLPVFLLISFFPVSIHSQVYALENSVQLTATASMSPDAVHLQWKTNPAATQYKVYRKIPSSIAWGAAMATLPGTDSTYTDNTVTSGTLYEYRVDRIAPTTAFGYITSGVKTELAYNQGIIILVVDSFFIPALNTNIAQLAADYEADGWNIKQMNISRNQSVASVKNQMITTYNQDPTNTKSLLLLGHIPVPYSGLINPDGHPDHLGAWPADVFYADMDGNWTDASVNDNTSASDPRNHNIPGDGKYDPSTLPSTTELQIGRVDFYNLPGFTETETELMQTYLNKLHAFKTREFIPNEVALVEDNFGGYAEGFSSSGYTNFSTFVGPENIVTADWLTNLDTLNALWSYGCGGGWYQGAGGICTSADFATDSVLSVFNMLFGSYFGDWDVPNSFLRSPLASGTVLTNVWAGRPHWQFHQMAMGYPIGYCAQKTQNNSSTYYTSNLAPGYFGRWVHIALMGDPSLRSHYIAPPANLVALEDMNHVVQLSWTASAETVLGYHLYRKTAGSLNWALLNNSPVTGTSFNDSTLTAGGNYVYMVRAARDQTTASGTYKNLSLGSIAGISSDLMVTNNPEKPFIIFPNPANNYIHIKWVQSPQNDLVGNLYDALGAAILSYILPAGSSQITLDISTLSPGLYYLQMNGSTAKFIKN